MKQKLKLILGITGFIVVIVAVAFMYNRLKETIVPADNTGTPEAGKDKAPDFIMSDTDGNNISLHEIIANGKPVVLNFWASWCPPCKGEMPEFETVYREFGNEVQFIMINLADGQRETVETGTKYIKDQGYTFPVYFDTKLDGASSYGINSIPTTLFIDKDGYISTQVIGSINENALKSEIEKIR